MSRDSEPVAASKRMAYALRHRPASLGLALDAGGWVAIEDLLAALAATGPPVSRELFDRVIAGTDKKRFEVQGGRVRAAQGHSVAVELGLRPSRPPALLFHGTVERALVAIQRDGLRPMSRQHVHLSGDPDTARAVGARRGMPVVLVVAAGQLADRGVPFYRAANGVWLVAQVPPGRCAGSLTGAEGSVLRLRQAVRQDRSPARFVRTAVVARHTGRVSWWA